MPIRKTLYTLCVNDYAPAIRELTFPLLKHHAAKIGADFHVITERKYPDWPITYEKFQVGELARERQDDWAIFFDADTLINPEQFDVTNHLPRNTVAHNGKDVASIRWRYDNYMRRDGRNIGSCTWCVICSDWCLDLWHRPEEPLSELLPNISITVGEHNSGQCKQEHLIDDYLLSRNIARYGLKFRTIIDICEELGIKGPNGQGISFALWHKYTMTEEQKLREMVAVLSTPQQQPAFAEQGEVMNSPQGPVMKTRDGRIIAPAGIGWGFMSPQQAEEFRTKWNLKY